MGHKKKHIAGLYKKLTLKLINVFLKVANHPGLFFPDSVGDLTNLELDETLLAAVPNASQCRDEFFAAHNCGKMRVLDALLSALHRQVNNKVLLFSHSVKLLNIIEKHVNSKRYAYLRLDGQTKTATRQQLVDTFNRDQNIFLFLISTRYFIVNYFNKEYLSGLISFYYSKILV